MRLFFYIFVLVALVVLIYYYIKIVLSRIHLRFQLDTIKLGSFSVSNIKDDKATVRLNIRTIIDNQNKFNITFSDVYVWLIWNSQVVAKTADVPEAKKRVLVPAKGSVDFIEPLDVYVNPNTIKFVAAIKLQSETYIDYEVQLKLFGFNFRVSDTYKYTKDEQVA